MASCQVCGRESPADSRFCPQCGTPLGPGQPASPEATVTARPAIARPVAQESFGSSSSDSIDQARFTPGTLLTERYRIVGLLGKGGMGEVYRADDLKLRQPVALKFLPEALSQDPRKLERFLHEVRVARQVSHPNVCRVYDISEADGQHFISMEYVDGEDLAAVLRRLGRPSKDKALQIARQLCAGLAAAHDKGVLHRDLKPHNVMIDGRGTVRITDFGLAGFVEDFAGREIHAGTPAYMAPEQLSGRGVSVKSDLYSLGLVLCEIFTGKRLFDGDTREQLNRSRSSVPTNLSTFAEDLDPAVERVILRCLEPEPAARPSSAMAVAAALPGGDPLAAALAAGETPSPEMVANAGETVGMRPALAIACLVAILGGTFALVPLAKPLSLARLVPLPKPPQVLADRAAEILTKLGHKGPVVDTAYGFDCDGDDLKNFGKADKSVNRWERLAHLRPSLVYFWYRQSPRTLIPPSSYDYVYLDEPLLDISGMTRVFLDPLGRLLALTVVPPQREGEPVSGERRARGGSGQGEPPAPDMPGPTDWSVLFSEAQIDPNLFAPTQPRWNPERYCDERAAWEGRFVEQPEVTIRIEAGAYRGKPTFFMVVGPWIIPGAMEELPRTLGERLGDIFVFSVLLILILGGLLVARKNLKLRRSDRTGANRLALACFCLLLVSWLLLIDHVPDFVNEFFRLYVLTGMALVAVAVVWLWYIALEPYVRRRWPQVLISWSRLLAGRLRDPLVGRDILVGGVFASGLVALNRLSNRVPVWLGEPLSDLEFWDWRALLGPRYQIGECLGFGFAWWALLLLFLLFGLRLLLKKQWLVFLAVWVLQAIPVIAGASAEESLTITAVRVVLGGIDWSINVLVALRFGLLALAFSSIFYNLMVLPGAFGLSGWQAEPAWMALFFIAVVAAYGCHTAMAGRSLFRDELLES